MTGYPIQLIFDQPEQLSQPRKPAISRKSLLAKLFNDINTLDDVEKVLAFDNNLKFEKLQNSQFLIGSKTYRISGNDIFNKKPGAHYEANVEFTHKGYFVRRERNGVIDSVAAMKVIDDTDNSDLSLIVPSLFPNYIDDKYLVSLERDDIAKPALTAAPGAIPAANRSDSSAENPLFF